MQKPNKMVSCEINGQKVEVPEGTSIIEAYSKIKQDIAHYCWHPELSVAGVCRLCVVEIKDQPKLQIACNTKVEEGMVINNKSPKVEEAVRWGLDFHLINHPLDCPICDQAGECGLQEQYMKFGAYDSSMSEHKVRKRKVVDLGPKIVLDAERCILCSRCVRFTEEITKTNELGIFNRGDHSEIGTVKDKPLDNDYAVNTVDICPVGALTSKSFRFQQRVWYLQNTTTTCPGCSTGCSVKVFYNKEGVFRLKPNTDVQPWMCDEGRETFKHTRASERLLSCQKLDGEKLKSISQIEAFNLAKSKIEKATEVGVLITGQQTLEEYVALKSYFSDEATYTAWKNSEGKEEDFDGFLKRGDKNPNTKGMEKTIEKFSPFSVLEKKDLVFVVMPENKDLYPDYLGMLEKIKSFKNVIMLTVAPINQENIKSNGFICIPMKTFVEKSGTYLNYSGEERKIQEAVSLVTEAVSLVDFFNYIRGNTKEPDFLVTRTKTHSKRNEFLNKVDA